MDWYFGSGIADLIVPKEDQGLSDRLPSPDSWSKWGVSGPENFPSQYKCGAFGSEFTAEEDGFETISLSEEVQIDDSVGHKYSELSNLTRSSISRKDQYEESIPSEKNHVNGNNDDETYFEEAVLLDLQMVMSQLPEKIQICIRDSLYRLAKNSDQYRMTQNQHGDLFVDIPPVCALDAEMTRSGTKRSTESKSNVIDRAIASLMFNKMDFNARNLRTAGEFDRVSRPFDLKSYQTQIHSSSNHQITPEDAEVPIFKATANSDRVTGSGNRSMVVDFGSVGE